MLLDDEGLFPRGDFEQDFPLGDFPRGDMERDFPLEVLRPRFGEGDAEPFLRGVGDEFSFPSTIRFFSIAAATGFVS